MTNQYEHRINVELLPYLTHQDKATRELAARIRDSAVKLELAHRGGYSAVVAMELARYERLTARFGCDPLDR